jgi:hypothetical protein
MHSPDSVMRVILRCKLREEIFAFRKVFYVWQFLLIVAGLSFLFGQYSDWRVLTLQIALPGLSGTSGMISG